MNKSLDQSENLVETIKDLSLREGTHVETWVSVALAFILTVVGCGVFWRMQAALKEICSELGATTISRIQSLFSGTLLPFLALSAGSFLVLVITVLAMRWTRMRLEREQREKQVSDLVLRLISQSQDENLERISSWLHDEIGHGLVLQKMSVEYMLQKRLVDAKEGNQMIRQLNDLIAATRNMAGMIYPVALFEFGLASALESLLENFQTVSHIRVEHDLQGLTTCCSDEVALLVFRILQEALTNIAKHADASYVFVKIDCGPNGLAGYVRNDGVLETTHSDHKKTGIGIVLLTERAKRLKGEVTVQQKGTDFYCLSFSFPSPPS